MIPTMMMLIVMMMLMNVIVIFVMMIMTTTAVIMNLSTHQPVMTGLILLRHLSRSSLKLSLVVYLI